MRGLGDLMTAAEWRVWAVLQMAITGSGALPLPSLYSAPATDHTAQAGGLQPAAAAADSGADEVGSALSSLQLGTAPGPS